MSPALRRGGSLVALTYSGRVEDPRDTAFADKLAQHRFRTIENAASEEVSVGWCTPGDPTGDSFLVEDMDAGCATWLRLRTDSKKLPAEWMAVHLAAAEKARGRRLSAKERRELKDDLTEKLLPRVLPKMAFTDALFFHDQRKVLLLSSSKSVRETFAKLWFETFGVPLDVQGPRGIALRSVEVADVATFEKLQPTRWPVSTSGQRTFDFADGDSFLGEELLTWLWFQCEAAGGEFTLPGGRVVGVAIDDLLVFAAGGDDATAQTMRHGMPTRAPESREALRHGHRLAKARLLIAEGTRQWTVTIDGTTMALGSVKLPEDAEECESPEDRTGDRAANWLAIHTIVEQLFGRFLRVRVGPDWITGEAAAMAGWMAS